MPSDLTTLDFYDIRESIKSYLKTRSEFTDYNFEGSTLSYLIDVLAYNTQYSAFYGNLAANELFLDTATIRDNVVKIAKLLNYTPRSVQSSVIRVSIAFQTVLGPDGEYPSNLTLKKGPVLSSSLGNQTGYVFNTLNDITTTVNQTTGRAQFIGIVLYEGNILNYSYNVDSNQSQRYIIPNSNVDTKTLKVIVKPSVQSTEKDVYKLADSLEIIGPEQKVYFLQEVEDTRYEVFFGDGKTGRRLVDGEVVELEYLITNADQANGCQKVSFIGTVEDSYNRRINTAPALKVLNRAQNGSQRESIEKIKFNAPKFYATQARAVTSKDYENLTRIVYPQTEIVSVTGGENLRPPQYGKVFITIQNKNKTSLNSLTRRRIVQELKKYSVASIELIVLDAKRYYVDPKVIVKYDSSRSTKNQQQIYNIVSDALYQYGQKNFNKFGGTLNYSKIVKFIDDSDASITSINLSVRLRQIINAILGKDQTYCFDFGVPLRDPLDCLSQNLKSKRFKIIGFSEFVELDDDNKGNIRLFYYQNGVKLFINDKIGFIDYSSGKLCIGPINISEPASIPISVIPKDPTVNFPFDTIPEIGFPNVIDVYFNDVNVDANSDWTPPPLLAGDGSGAGNGVGAAAGVGANGAGTSGAGGITGTGTGGTNDGTGGPSGSNTGSGAGGLNSGTPSTDTIPDSFFDTSISYENFTGSTQDNCFN